MMIDLQFIEEIKNTKVIRGENNTTFDGISIDSRKIKPGEIFIAIKGETYNGHDFVTDAINSGAKALVVESELENDQIPNDITIIQVVSTIEFLGELSHRWRKSFKNLKVACITGSNGKTTSKEMAASILSVNNTVHKNSGNYNNHIGLPLTLLKLNESHDICVTELGMNDFGEIRQLTRIAEPDVGTITNIGRAHLEKLGDIEGVALSKSELVENFNSNNTFIVNLDDPRVFNISKKINCKKITYGINCEVSHLKAFDIKSDDHQFIKFKMQIGNHSIDMRIKGIGQHNVMNALCASGIGLSLGCSDEEIQIGLERYTPSHMRLEIIESPQGFKIINDSYNANPDSMTKAIEELSRLKNNNKTIAILGDMLELGVESPKQHRSISQILNSNNIDYVIAYGKYAKCILEGLENRIEASTVDSHKEAADILVNIASPNDLVLIKGSRGMKMEKVIQHLY